MSSAIEEYCSELRAVVANLPFDVITRVEDALMECYHEGGTVFILGNGGSAATASHFACDLTKGTRHDALPRFRVVALTDNMPLMTAWANDASYDRVFAEQLASLVRPRDLVLVISASGNSPNVLEAARAAESAGAHTVALTGATGGELARVADITVRVPADTAEQVEDGHSVITHALTVALRARLHSEAESIESTA